MISKVELLSNGHFSLVRKFQKQTLAQYVFFLQYPTEVTRETTVVVGVLFFKTGYKKREYAVRETIL